MLAALRGWKRKQLHHAVLEKKQAADDSQGA
jgi:hypothetical protein